MQAHRRSVVPLLLVVAAPVVLARCQCGDPLQGLPEAQIEILDDQGNSHLDAEPWLVIDFGDADSGQSVTRNVTLKDNGTGPLLIEKTCLVNAADLDTARTAPCITGQTTAFTFTDIGAARLKPGTTVDVPVTFAPHAGGPANLFLQVTSTAVKEPVAAVQLVGRGTDGRLCAEPSGIFDFGDVDIGATAPGQITVRNCGVKPVTIDSFALSQNPDDAFTFTPQGGDPTGRTLNQDETIVLDLTFTPAQPGPYSDNRAGDIHVVTAAPFAAEYDLILIGNGVTPPACHVHVVPQVVNYNAVASGTAATRQLIVQSVGQCACTLDAISDPSPADQGFTLGTVPALPMVLKGTVGCDGDPAGAAAAPSSLTVDVTFTAPVQNDATPFNASLDVSTSDADAPVQTVNLEANGGGAPFCQLAVSPQESGGGGFSVPTQGRYGVVEFGRTSVHVPKQEPITLENTGNIDCHVTGVAYDDAQNTVQNEFSVVTEDGQPANGMAAFAIAPGETRTLFAVFSPTHTLQADGLFGSAFSFGSYSGTLFQTATGCHLLNTAACNGVTFTTDDTTTDVSASGQNPGVYSIGFKGTPVAPSVDVIPGSLDFGLVTLDCGSPTQRVSVYNNGGADLVVDEPVVDPAETPEVFRVEGTTNFSNTWPFTIPAGGSMSIEVRYFARQLGVQAANLIIPTVEGGSAGPPVTIPLRGEGTTDTSQTDTFDQFGDPKVDVLWVVDDSASMDPYQNEMATNFSQFFVSSNVSNADFHIGVTTTLTAKADCIGGPPSCQTNADCGAGGTCAFHLCTAGNAVNSCDDDPMCGWYTSCSNEHFLSPSSPNVDSQFQCNVHTSGGANPSRPGSDSAEGGFRAAYRFLTPENITDPSINGGFMRDDAKLHVIMVSDEPEQSKGSVDEYIDFFRNLKGFRNSSLVAVSAIAPPENGCTLADGTQVSGDSRYKALVDALNGRFESICNPDWTTMMSQLGLDSLGLRVEFFLSRAAEEASITVCVKSSPSASQCVPQTKTSDGAANGWFYDPVDNSVVFNAGSVPPRGSQIVVDYGTFCF